MAFQTLPQSLFLSGWIDANQDAVQAVPALGSGSGPATWGGVPAIGQASKDQLLLT
jgi:hypothetical protein